jgi:hypothetical protein
MGRRTRQLLALCRKTYWLKRNRWILTFLEFFLSAGWIVAGAILTSHVISTTQPISDDPTWSRLPPVTNTSNWVDCSSQNNGTCILAISPNFNETHPIPALLMANLLQGLESSIVPPLQYQFFESEDDLLTYYNANPSLVWNGKYSTNSHPSLCITFTLTDHSHIFF